MSGTWPTWDTLNAYVDGELSTRESAAVARALVSRQDLTEQLAQISRLKMAVQESVPHVEVVLPAERHALPWPTLAVLGGLLLVVLAAAVLWFGG